MLKFMDKIGKVIFEVCSSAIVVGGAMVIYQKIFLNSVQIGEILHNTKEARKAVKDNG